MSKQNWVTASEAAKALNLTPKVLRKQIRSGKFGTAARKTGNNWELDLNNIPQHSTKKATTGEAYHGLDDLLWLGPRPKKARRAKKSSANVQTASPNTDAGTEAYRRELKAETARLRKQYPEVWDRIPETD